MEELNFVKNGVPRLPPGFRFRPTDEELIVQYLKRKVLSFPLPSSIIPEVDVYKSDPWDLPGDLEQERYFLSTREVKYPNGNRSNRATNSGYWKATGIDKQIVSCRGQQLVGLKKTLVFYRGKPQHGCRTNWIMHEYRLTNLETSTPQAKNHPARENWVLCRIFLKRRGRKNEDQNMTYQVFNSRKPKTSSLEDNKKKPVFHNFMENLNEVPASSSFSGTSGITELTTNEPDDHEESSSYFNTFTTTFRRIQ